MRGETALPLKERFKKHLDANHSNTRQMPWAKHICQKHANEDGGGFGTARVPQNAKIKEAVHVQKEHEK